MKAHAAAEMTALANAKWYEECEQKYDGILHLLLTEIESVARRGDYSHRCSVENPYVVAKLRDTLTELGYEFDVFSPRRLPTGFAGVLFDNIEVKWENN